MLTATVFVSLLIFSELPVDVAKLDGGRLSGQLQSLTPSELVVLVEGERLAIPADELQEVRPSVNPAATALITNHAELGVMLRDGSLLLPGEFSASSREATLVHPRWGELRLPKGAVANVRLSRTDQNLNAAWNALLEREPRNDLVIVRKGDALDHVEGVVGTINSDSVSLLLDGQAIPIPRSRVFGVIYAAGGAQTAKPLCRFDLADGQQLVAQSARFEGDGFTVAMASDGEVNIAAADVRRIDFSLGKIRALADMEPAAVDYPPGLLPELASVWKFRRGHNSHGEPLLLGGRSYDDGLWIHSGTTLRYRLGREYRRFRGQMGIDEDIGDCAPQVGVVFRGDGRVLQEVSVSRGDAVRELDLDVTDVRELEITVTSTDPDGICEHLDLVEARLIK
ncbi:MAG: NPCBM/NEW2 domain-containing protein [Planctomycetaceae bacterium]